MKRLLKWITLILLPHKLWKYQRYKHLLQGDDARYSQLLFSLAQLEQGFLESAAETEKALASLTFPSRHSRWEGITQRLQRSALRLVGQSVLPSEHLYSQFLKEYGNTEHTQRFCYLPGVIQANHWCDQGRYEDARQQYELIIQQVERQYAKLLKRQGTIKEQRHLAYFSAVLALLYTNLAIVMERLQEREAAVQLFNRARDLQAKPTLLHILTQKAYYYLRGQDWEKAADMFQEIYRCSNEAESLNNLRWNLTYLERERGAALLAERKGAEAIPIFRKSIAQAQQWQLTDWEGNLRFMLASAYKAAGQTDLALAELTASMRCYETAKDLPSASYLAEQRADLLVEMQADEPARQAFLEALDYAGRPLPEDASLPEETPAQKATRLIRLKLRLGVLQLRAGQSREGRQSLQESQALIAEQEEFNPFRRMVLEAEPLLERPDLLAVLKLHFHAALRQEPSSSVRRRLIEALRLLLDRSPRLVTADHLQAWQQLGEELPKLNLLTPIAVEIDALSLEQMGGPDDMIETLLPAMRQRLESQRGVRIPGVRLRANETGWPRGSYLILIDEIPQVSASLRPEASVILADAAQLQQLGLPGDAPVEADWLGAAFWLDTGLDRARQAGLEVWSSKEYMIRHLEQVLSRQLVAFEGHQEVQNHLQQAGLIANDRTEELVERESCQHMDPLSRVVRELVAERVPIGDFERLYHLFLEAGQGSTAEVVGRMRRHPSLRDQLWGNDSSYQFLLLESSFTEALRAVPASANGEVQAIGVDQLSECLRLVRQALEHGQPQAVVVARQEHRALVRGILNFEFPETPVLSLAELKPGLGSQITERLVSL